MIHHPLLGAAPRNGAEDGGGDAGRGEAPQAPPRRRSRRRSAWRSPPSEAEVARMVAEFHARGGAVTRCPPVCLLPIRNGAGLDAAPPRHGATAAPGRED